MAAAFTLHPAREYSSFDPTTRPLCCNFARHILIKRNPCRWVHKHNTCITYFSHCRDEMPTYNNRGQAGFVFQTQGIYTFQHGGKTMSGSEGSQSHCISSPEATQVPHQSDLLPPARLTTYACHNLPKECHSLGTKCSNTQGDGESSNDKQTHTSNMYYIIHTFTLIPSPYYIIN